MTPERAREYSRWQMMLRRCEDSRLPNYRYYGGRGIGVCERWHDFENYYADIMRLIGACPDGMTLDRTDNDGGYEPGNVRWATRRQQQLNSRNARHGQPRPARARRKRLEALPAVPETGPRSFQMMKPPQVCAVLGISYGKVLRLIHSGELDAIHIGRHYRVSEASVEEYISRSLPGRPAVTS